MDIGEIIGSSIAIFIIGLWFYIYYKTKDRKESLVIMEDDDKIKLFLKDDDYYEFCINEIKNDKEKVYEEIKNVIKAKLKELIKFVDKVKFFKNGDPKKEQELLNMILSAKR